MFPIILDMKNANIVKKIVFKIVRKIFDSLISLSPDNTTEMITEIL